MDANIESIRNLRDNLSEHGLDLATMPYVLQLNKRDLPTALPADVMAEGLRIQEEEVFEAVATTGAGVFETLKALARKVLLRMKKRH